ncbi:DMT family transporter [Saccharothrix longispora]|uniref:DMT family transporter n=1 Tax=Saccharothrix longispora TaxID=33920 RepID=UPI0028FD7207|nr:DMT family transporter [Saccharothrix longispora]MBY8848444.1 DMT family transporter [Saccharothrix sp. MB29]MDU0288619.1 DMT family transporter [Saccharothrix longispora]
MQEATPVTTPVTTPVRPPVRGIAAGITAMVLVGGSVGVSGALVDAPLFTAQAVRYAAAIVVLALAARLFRVPVVRPRGREWWWLAGIAATGLVLFNVAVVRGVAHAEPAVVAVAIACVPVVIGVVGPLLERRTPQGPVLVAAVVVTAGAALVEGAGRADAQGVAWAAVAMVCEAAFTLLAIPVLGRHGAWGVSLHSVWLGAVMFGVLGLVAEGAGAVTEVTATQWAAVAYLAVMVTAVAFVLWYSTVAALGSGRVGLLTGVAPVAAALAGIAVGSRAPGPLVWAGMAVVVLGLALGLRHRSGDAEA